jgi:hypothetical protein
MTAYSVRNDRRPALLGALLLTALVAGWLSLVRGPGTPWGPGPMVQPPQATATATQPPFDTTTYERMLSAPDLKAFVGELEARRRPGDGLMAFEVRLYCGVWDDAKRAMAVPGLTPGVPASRRDAVQAELNRCAGFTPEERDVRAVVAARDSALAWDERLRLAVAMKGLAGVQRPWEDRLAMAREALATRDSVSLLQNLPLLMQASSAGVPTWVIEGQRYGGSVSERRSIALASSAWGVALCEFTGTCGARPLMHQFECLVHGLIDAECPTERARHLNALPLTDRPEAEALAARLLRHLQRGDLSALRGEAAPGVGG